MKNEANMTPPKDTNKLPVTNPKEMKIYELLNKELKIIILRSSMQYKRHRQTNKTRKTMYE